MHDRAYYGDDLGAQCVEHLVPLGRAGLVTFLVLWLIFLSFSVMRNFGDPAKTATHGAVLGILGAASVPLVWLSIRLLPQSARLHPEVIERGGLRSPSYWWAFGVSALAMISLAALLILLRYALEATRARVRELEVADDGSMA